MAGTAEGCSVKTGLSEEALLVGMAESDVERGVKEKRGRWVLVWSLQDCPLRKEVRVKRNKKKKTRKKERRVIGW